jgi:hypothetical protein
MNWKNNLCPHEIQFQNAGTGKAFDTAFCITFSAQKVLKTSTMYKLSNHQMPNELVTWLKDKGYFENGFINFSKRFTGILGGTTKKGATQERIINSILCYGLIPEKMFPNKADTLAEYTDSTKITTEMYALGQEFLEKFKITVSDARLEDIKTSPLQAIVRYADGEGILAPKGDTNHGLVIYNVEDNYVDVCDSFWDEFKRYDKSFVHYLKKFTINPRNMTDNEKFLMDNDLKWCQNKMTGQFGRIMQGKLFTVHSNDRGALVLLDNEVRKTAGLKIEDTLWNNLDKKEF